MKTLLALSLLPLAVAAYFFSEQFYIAANYVPAYALIVLGIGSLVYCIYQIGGKLQNESAYRP